MPHSTQEEILSMRDPRTVDRGDVSVAPTRGDLIEVMFRRHYAELVRVAVVMLGNREAAEDAVQEAFVSLARNWRSLRDPHAAEAYLRSAVLNGGRSWIRRQVTQRAPRPLTLVRLQQESAEDTTVCRAEAGELVAALRTLARRQREVLTCRYVLEMSVAETAQLLQMSAGSVKAHTHRGLHVLQQRVEVTR